MSEQSHRKRLIANTIFPAGTGLIAQAIHIFILPLFIQNLGVEMYGLFVISSILIGYVGVFDFGFTQGLTRQIGRAYSDGDEDAMADAVSTGFWLLVAIGVFSAGAIYFGRFLLVDFLRVDAADRATAATLFTATALFSLLQWPLKLFQVILRGTLHIKQEGILQAATAVCVSLAMLGLVLWSVEVVVVRVGVFAVMAAGLLLQWVLVRRYVPELRWNIFAFRQKVCREMSVYSGGMFYTKLLSLLSIRVDHLIIGGMVGIGSIAPYVVASRLFELVANNSSKIFAAVLPTVFSLDTDVNRHKLQTLLDVGVRYRALLVTPIAYLGIVISPSFIRTWMGPEYVQYAIWSQLFMVPHLFNVFGIAVHIARGRGKLFVTNSILSIRVAVNVALSITLTPFFGIGGPIIGTLVASTLLGDGVFIPIFARICGLQAGKALKQGLAILIANLPATLVLLYVLPSLQIDSWGLLLVTAGACCVVFYGTLFLAFVNAGEKRDLYMVLEAVGLTRLNSLERILKRIILKET